MLLNTPPKKIATRDLDSDDNIEPAPTSRHHRHTAAMSTAELASSYAALILADDGVEITVSRPPSTPPAHR